MGELRRPMEITSEDEQAAHFDTHFNAQDALYRETCREMGVGWPPSVVDDAEEGFTE